jgi:hypothetical protein
LERSIEDAMVTEDDSEDKSPELCFNVIIFIDLSLRNGNSKLSFVESFFDSTTHGDSPVNGFSVVKSGDHSS